MVIQYLHEDAVLLLGCQCVFISLFDDARYIEDLMFKDFLHSVFVVLRNELFLSLNDFSKFTSFFFFI